MKADAEICKRFLRLLLASGLLVCHWPKSLSQCGRGQPGEGHREAAKVRARDAVSPPRASSWPCPLPALGAEAQNLKLSISASLLVELGRDAARIK